MEKPKFKLGEWVFVLPLDEEKYTTIESLKLERFQIHSYRAYYNKETYVSTSPNPFSNDKFVPAWAEYYYSGKDTRDSMGNGEPAKLYKESMLTTDKDTALRMLKAYRVNIIKKAGDDLRELEELAEKILNQ